jgi:D-alanyl-D-alanine carboxypeptidase
LLTADAVLVQINKGTLARDARLAELLPEWNAQADSRLAEMTVEQLLRHREGFDRLLRPDPMVMHDVKPWCPDKLSESAHLKLDFDPGSRFGYSNLGYCLLGVVLERLSGKPFRELMNEEYGLVEQRLEFVDGPYRPDEVSYDFRNSLFYMADYYRHFDFQALSSSAGLSGSAVALTHVIHKILQRQPLNILSEPPQTCDSDHDDACRTLGGAVVSRWSGSTLVLYGHSGLLFGSSAQIIIDNKGGVLVWLGNGMPLNPKEKTRKFTEYVRKLYSHYDGL